MSAAPEAPPAAREVFGGSFETISRYVELLASAGLEWGLIGPKEVDRLWERHILNSVALADLIPHGASVADVGSGAGLPGIPLAVLRPDLRMDLLEPLLRRSNFLNQALASLGIADRVTVTRVRAEDQRARYDVVVSRALAPLPRLVEWCDPLRARGGTILALKGRSAADEVDGAFRLLAARHLRASVLTVRSHPSSEPTTVVRLVSDRVNSPA
ncbi:MAG: 16S rRNA (guanine(527)-N(7))-methyltransferase RsmG [Propionibacteriaceae bacterium]